MLPVEQETKGLLRSPTQCLLKQPSPQTLCQVFHMTEEAPAICSLR